jgi:hypothetical protein
MKYCLIQVDSTHCSPYQILHLPWFTPFPIGGGRTRIPSGSAPDWLCLGNQVKMRNNFPRPLIGFVVTNELTGFKTILLPAFHFLVLVVLPFIFNAML